MTRTRLIASALVDRFRLYCRLLISPVLGWKHCLLQESTTIGLYYEYGGISAVVLTISVAMVLTRQSEDVVDAREPGISVVGPVVVLMGFLIGRLLSGLLLLKRLDHVRTRRSSAVVLIYSTIPIWLGWLIGPILGTSILDRLWPVYSAFLVATGIRNIFGKGWLASGAIAISFSLIGALSALLVAMALPTVVAFVRAFL